MPYITILGAGSTVFARQLMTDILQIEGLDEGCFALVDIDANRLELARQIAERLITRSGKRWRVRASTERRDLLAGSDFLINAIEVAGLAQVARPAVTLNQVRPFAEVGDILRKVTSALRDKRP